MESYKKGDDGIEQEHEQESEQDCPGAELYHRYLAGDDSAFEGFVELYEDELSRFINSIIGDYHETKHLTIETFAQLILNKKKFEGRSSIKTYLFAIGRNLSMRHLKKRGREQHVTYDEVMELLVHEGDSMHLHMEREENKQHLHDVMLDLKDEYRRVLLLIYFDGMSYSEAGEEMDKSEKQIKDLAYRAKLTLRKKLDKAGFVIT